MKRKQEDVFANCPAAPICIRSNRLIGVFTHHDEPLIKSIFGDEIITPVFVLPFSSTMVSEEDAVECAVNNVNPLQIEHGVSVVYVHNTALVPKILTDCTYVSSVADGISVYEKDGNSFVLFVPGDPRECASLCILAMSYTELDDMLAAIKGELERGKKARQHIEAALSILVDMKSVPAFLVHENTVANVKALLQHFSKQQCIEIVHLVRAKITSETFIQEMVKCAAKISPDEVVCLLKRPWMATGTSVGLLSTISRLHDIFGRDRTCLLITSHSLCARIESIIALVVMISTCDIGQTFRLLTATCFLSLMKTKTKQSEFCALVSTYGLRQCADMYILPSFCKHLRAKRLSIDQIFELFKDRMFDVLQNEYFLEMITGAEQSYVMLGISEIKEMVGLDEAADFFAKMPSVFDMSMIEQLSAFPIYTWPYVCTCTEQELQKLKALTKTFRIDSHYACKTLLLTDYFESMLEKLTAIVGKKGALRLVTHDVDFALLNEMMTTIGTENAVMILSNDVFSTLYNNTSTFKQHVKNVFESFGRDHASAMFSSAVFCEKVQDPSFSQNANYVMKYLNKENLVALLKIDNFVRYVFPHRNIFNHTVGKYGPETAFQIFSNNVFCRLSTQRIFTCRLSEKSKQLSRSEMIHLLVDTDLCLAIMRH